MTMRLLVLIDDLGARGGALRYLRDLLTVLANRHEIVVATGHGGSGGRGLPPGVELRRLTALAAPEAHGDLSAYNGLLSWADRVLVQNVMNPLALAVARSSGKATVIVQDHRVFCPGPGKTLPDGRRCEAPMATADCSLCLPDAGYRERMCAVTTARTDAIRGARLVVLSRYMADELALAGLPGAVVIPPGVQVGPPRTDPGEGFLLAGRLVAHKGVDLGQAAWRASGVDAPLRLAGAGRLGAALEGAEALGWLDGEALRHALRGSRALLFPARWQEPFGIAGLEALAQGVPVIAMATGGVPEWAGAGAMVVPAGDIAAMARCITALQQDPALALTLGEQGRQQVAEGFSHEAFAAAWEGWVGVLPT